jgi:hypothetical protein
MGARGSVMVKAVCYKLESCGFDSFRLHWALGFTQPLKEVSIRNIKIVMFLESKVWPVHRADNLTPICEPIV